MGSKQPLVIRILFEELKFFKFGPLKDRDSPGPFIFDYFHEKETKEREYSVMKRQSSDYDP